MRLTFLGHAGFLLETPRATIALDPWLSSHGAFDSSWFQLPQNHHLAEWVRAKLSDPSKERFVYVSHEHRDHYDPVFLASLPTHEITAIIPFFKRAAFRNEVSDLGWGRLVLCKDDAEIPFADGVIRLFVSDSTLNRDSAILVRSTTGSFFDLNDCKIHDRLEELVKREGPPTAFSAQFSGAIWHPPRYDYDERTYSIVAKKKMFSKFEAVARAIQTLSPRFYIAAAGPACFLDPDLLHENFRQPTIFPRAPEYFRFLARRLGNVATRLVEPMPGDTIDLETGAIDEVGERLTDENCESYVRAYSERMMPVLATRQRNISQLEARKVVDRLEVVLQEKLDRLALRERITMPLYAMVEEVPDAILRVDFPAGRIDRVDSIPEDNRHVFRARAGDLLPLVDRKMTWDEFLLSLRFTLSRRPDVYDPVLHGFLAVEAEDLPAFCNHILEAESRQERMVVQIGTRRFLVNRYCPHQGADLVHAWMEKGRYLVCPRHRWQFDLENGGKCTFNDCSIRAVELPGAEAPAERIEAVEETEITA